MPQKVNITKFQLATLQKEHGSDQNIGANIGITRQAVHHLRKKFGLPSLRANSGERNRIIMVAYEKGKTGIEIGQKLGMSSSQIYRIIRSESKRTGIDPAPLDKRRSV